MDSGGGGPVAVGGPHVCAGSEAGEVVPMRSGAGAGRRASRRTGGRAAQQLSSHRRPDAGRLAPLEIP